MCKVAKSAILIRYGAKDEVKGWWRQARDPTKEIKKLGASRRTDCWCFSSNGVL